MTLFLILGIGLMMAGGLLIFAQQLARRLGHASAKIGPFEVSGPVGLVVAFIGVVVLLIPHTSIFKSADAHPGATLDYPKDGTAVSQQRGFKAGGTVTDVDGDHTIWLLDYDDGYYVDGQAEIINNVWSILDQPLGDTNDSLPYTLTVRVVIADPACTAALAQTAATDADYIENLPLGCSILGQTSVKVTSR